MTITFTFLICTSDIYVYYALTMQHNGCIISTVMWQHTFMLVMTCVWPLVIYSIHKCGKMHIWQNKRSTEPLNTNCLSEYVTKSATLLLSGTSTLTNTRSVNKVRELIAVKVLHTSFLKTTMVALKVLPLGSYEPMPAPSPPFKTETTRTFCQQLMDLASRQCTCPHSTVCEGVFSY
jgi:hypothetical protein